MIPYGKQNITKSDIDSVVDVLNSDFLTQGPMVPKFESELVSYCGSKNAIVVNNCTSALHLACLSLGLGKGDVLWTSAITFVSSANCAIYCGATVDFVDVQEETALMCIDSLRSKLLKAKNNGKLPKVVIPVHFAGQSCNMKEIYNLGIEYGFKIIEDAAHAIGGYYRGSPIGSCKYSDITVFSFHPVKIITTGEGGAILTNNKKYANQIQILRSHGIVRDDSTYPWYYEQIELGFNYRMTDIQAALGVSQIKRLDEYVSKRAEISKWYDNFFIDNTCINPLIQKNNRTSSYHLYVIRVLLGKNARDKLFDYLRGNGVGVNLHYIPVYRQPYHKSDKKLNGAESYYKKAISLPIYPTMQKNDIQKVVDSVISGCKEVEKYL